MKHHFESQAIVVCDENRSVIGVNRNAINHGITQNVKGQMMNEELFNRLISKQKEKVSLSAEEEAIEGITIDKETKWELVCSTPFISEMPKFHIFLVESSNNIGLMTLSRFGQKDSGVNLETEP